MSWLGTRRGVVTLTVLAIAMSLSAIVHAHSAAEKVPTRWAPPLTNGPVDWAFEANFPTGTKRDRVADAADEWNTATNLDVTLDKVTNYGNFSPDGGCSIPDMKNGIHYGPIAGTVILAETRTCYVLQEDAPGLLQNAQIEFDNQWNWHSGSGGAGPNEFDFQSVATHEFGHFLGGEHFVGAELCDNANGPEQTMCGGIPAGNISRRTLEDHDIHPMENAY